MDLLNATVFLLIMIQSDEISLESYATKSEAVTALKKCYNSVLDSDDLAFSRAHSKYGHDSDWTLAEIDSRYDDFSAISYQIIEVPLTELVPEKYLQYFHEERI